MNALFSSAWVEAMGWTLLHSLWQGTAIALLAVAAVKVCGGRSARLNYAISCLSLAAIMLCSTGTLYRRFTPTSDHLPVAAPVVPEVNATVPSDEIVGTFEATPSPFSFEAALPVLVTLWAIGVLLMSLRFAFASLWIRRLRRTAALWEDLRWQEKLKDWVDEFGIRRTVRLCTSSLALVPSVIGHLKPVILLPAALVTQLTPQQLEAVILHELMHIRRHDFLVNLLQICCETLFFFNPAVWCLSRWIRIEREQACDELVAEYSGDRIGYAKALVRLEELRLGASTALALGATGSSLKRRITRLLGAETRRFTPAPWTGMGLLITLIGLTAFVAWPRAVAQEQKRSAFELRSVVPAGTAEAEELPFHKPDPNQPELSLSKRVLLDERQFSSVEVKDNPVSDRPEIWVTLTEPGADIFADITRTHVDRQIAIVVDGKIVSAPVVREPIAGGKFVISGNFTVEEAKLMAQKLRPDEPESASWTPPANALPSTILEEARAAVSENRYEEALARFEWYFKASRHEVGQGGVRLSFALNDWRRLGHAYPPALARLYAIRNEIGGALRARAQDRTVDEFTLFQEYAALNRTLGEESKTTELFLWLHEQDTELARQTFRVAQPYLLKAGEIDLCAEYARPSDFTTILLAFKQPRARISSSGANAAVVRVGEKRFIEQTATLIALLVHKGDEASAKEIAAQAVSAWNDATLKAAIDKALRGELPDGNTTQKVRPARPNSDDDTAEERALLEKEIDLTRKSIAALERAREVGRVTDDEIANHQRQIFRLEYELAWLTKNREGMIAALDREIAFTLFEIKNHRKKIEVGAATPESLIPLERNLLRAQRELTATRKGRAPQPERSRR